MKKILTLSIITFLISCNNSDNQKQLPIPKKLEETKLVGDFYNGAELESKLHKVINNSELDTFIVNAIFGRIEFFQEKYDSKKDQFGLTQTPANFLFADLNNDSIEDLIFQSNGPFIFDSHRFITFISIDQNKYKFVQEHGQIVEIEIIEEYCCATTSEKNRYLKVEYINWGCCDNPWDEYITGILNLGKGLFEDEFYITNLKAINRTKEYATKKEKTKKK
jgi:hypothetical protein